MSNFCMMDVIYSAIGKAMNNDLQYFCKKLTKCVAELADCSLSLNFQKMSSAKGAASVPKMRVKILLVGIFIKPTGFF